MSADLSEPAIVSAITSISDPVSPVSWMALKYHPTAEKTLILLSTGLDPWVPQWQETIEAHKAEPLFGYGVVAKGRPMREGGEKGVVLVYMPEEFIGVRRARAVVHSRALANKFPDYSAIITVSDASQITEEYVREQVNYYNQPVPTPTSSPVKPRTPAQMGITGLGHPSAKNGDTSLPSQQPILPSTSSIRSVDRPLPAPPAQPLDLPDNPRLNTPTPPRATTPPSGLRQVSDSASAQHGRKDSLSSRFAKVLPGFGKSTTKAENGDSVPDSPKSASRFTTGFGTGIGKKEAEPSHANDSSSSSPSSPSRFGALTSGFGTGIRRRDGEGQHERVTSQPRFEISGPMPIHDGTDGQTRGVHFQPGDHPTGDHPPSGTSGLQHDPSSYMPDHSAQSGSGSGMGSGYGTRGSVDTAPPPLPPKSGGSPTAPTFNRLHTLGAAIINWPSSRDDIGSTLPPSAASRSSAQRSPPPLSAAPAPPTQRTLPSPPSRSEPKNTAPFPLSPSATEMLSNARAKQLDVEGRVHDQFRRTEEERSRAHGHGHSPRTPSEEIKRSEEDQSRIRVNSGNRHRGIVRTPTPMREYDDEDEGLPYDRPERPEASPLGGEDVKALSSQAVTGHTGPPPEYAENPRDPQHVNVLAAGVGAGVGAVAALGAGAAIHAGQNDGRGQAEEEERQRRQAAAEEEQKRQADAEAARIRAAEEERRVQLEAEEKERQLQLEAASARAREESEARAREEEEARLRQEEELRIRQEEEVAAAAKAAEEAELKERLRIQAEAEALANEKEAERERVRKQSEVRAGMSQAKASGGVMLKGHVTVQTTKSVIWRRRYFHLLPAELQLFKEDKDTTPIQTISLAPGTQVSQTYEESQVQGSFKILSAGTGEDFLLFSDSTEEKEVLLEGLGVALGSENVRK